MVVAAAPPFIQGVQASSSFNAFKELENSVKAGADNAYTTCFQVLEGDAIITYAQKIFETQGRLPLSWKGQSLIYLMPIVAPLVKNSTFMPEKIRSLCAFLHGHWGTMYQVAAIASSIALLALGQTHFALPSLVLLGMGVIEQKGHLPLAYRAAWSKCTYPLFLITGIAFGGMLVRTLLITDIFTSLYDRFSKKEPHKIFTPQQNLTVETFQDYFKGNVKLRMNKAHIHHTPSPPIPNIDIQELCTAFGQINWTHHQGALLRKLKNDERYKETDLGRTIDAFFTQLKNDARYKGQDPWKVLEQSYPDLFADFGENGIKFASNGLQSFIQSVKTRNITEGAITQYDKLEGYLKIIAQHIQTEKDDIVRVDALLRLAIEGGDYCGSRKFHTAESVYNEIVHKNAALPFSDKVLCCLQEIRNNAMQSLYGEQQDPMGNRLHIYNIFVNLYGNSLGVQKGAADNDTVAEIPALCKLIIYPLTKMVQKQFWKEYYTLTHLTKELAEKMNTKQLPRTEFYIFWLKWIERQSISQAEKEKLKKPVINAAENENKLLKLIKLMLLDIGVLEIVPNTQITPHEHRS